MANEEVDGTLRLKSLAQKKVTSSRTGRSNVTMNYWMKISTPSSAWIL